VGQPSTITVTVRDAGGNPVQGVTVDLSANGAAVNTVVDPSQPTDANGQATGTFSSTGTGNHTIFAQLNGGVTVSDNAVVSVTVPPPASITITTQPSASAQAGVAFAAQPVVQLKDGNGNNSATANVTITATIASGTGGTLANATATTNGSGVAIFNGLRINGATGDYTIAFDADGLTGATSNTVSVSAGPASSLSFSQQPTDAASGATITPAVTVTVVDAFGNPASATVHLDLDVAPGVIASLGGTNDVATVGGVATFADLSVTQTLNLLNDPFTLTASATGASSATSSTFNIN
jgi:adhesin/invasin